MNLKARLRSNSQRVYKGTVGDVYFAEFASLIYVHFLRTAKLILYFITHHSGSPVS